MLEVCTAYTIVNELFRQTEISLFFVCLNGNGFFYHLLLIFIPIYSASKATEEGESTLKIVSSSMDVRRLNNSQKIDLICMLTQMKMRNLNFQNVFFRINWPVVLAVSLKKNYLRKYSALTFSYIF